jgi:hypothetical protein
MNYKTQNKIIEAICKGKNLFIKNTGIVVLVDYYGTDLLEFRRRGPDRRQFCNIEFLTTPTTKALKLLEKFHIKKNSHSKTMELDGVINLDLLSLSPYESKAGKLLYDKKGK